MSWFAWQEGFRLGVDEIDADHRHLIDLVRRVTGQEPDDRPLEALLLDLRAAAEAHFRREADLLRRINHPARADTLRHHLEQSDALVTILGSVARQGRVSAEVAEFLRTWLLNHIVCHDLRLRDSLREAGVAAGAPPHGSAWARLTRGLDRIGLRWRIVLIGLLPLLAVAAAGALEVSRTLDTARTMRDLAATTTFSTRAGALVHELQRERGLSSLYLSAPGPERAAALAEQRRTVDAAAEALAAAGGEAPDGLARLPALRRAVDVHVVSERHAANHYSGVVAALLQTVQDGVAGLTSELADDAGAYLLLMRSKERAGQERAAAAAGLAGGMGAEERARLQRLAAEQSVLQESFMLVAPPDLAAGYAAALAEADAAVAVLREAALAADGPQDAAAAAWYAAATRRIDAMKDIEDQLARHIIERAEALHEAAARQLMWLLAAIAALLAAVTLPTALLAGSVVPPLAALHRAVRRLAAGDRTVDIPGTALRDEIGALARTVASFRDGTIARDMLSLQARLEVSSLVRSIADHLPGVVFQHAPAPDGTPVCTYVSEKARYYAGAAPDALIGRPDPAALAGRIHPDDRDTAVATLRRDSAAGRPVQVEFRMRAADDSYRWLRVAMVPRRSPEGVPVWDGIALDVTDLKEAESQRSAAAIRLAQFYKLQALSQMAGGMGHEINNLLQPIIGLSELAAASVPEDSKAAMYMRNVLAAGQQARALVARITSVSRLDPLEREPVRLAEAIEQAAALLDGILPRQVSLRTDIADRDATILANAGEMQQVLMNLCTNAAHAIGDGPGTITLSVERVARGGEDLAVLRVADTGCGIPEAIRERIFDPFFTTKAVGKGSGLGLALVNSIVSGFGGHIEVASRPGHGATFSLSFPAWRGARQAAAETT